MHKISEAARHLMLAIIGVYDCKSDILKAAKTIIAKSEFRDVRTVNDEQVNILFIYLVRSLLGKELSKNYNHNFRRLTQQSFKNYVNMTAMFLWATYRYRAKEFGSPDPKILPLSE